MGDRGRFRGLPEDADVSQFYRNSLQRHVIEFGEWMARASIERARERGHAGLRPAHARLMVYLDWGGSRITDIAKAQDVSKNAIGQLVTDLEKLGYLERVPDPDDARAKIVRYTAAGRGLIADARDIGVELDAEVEAVLGPERMTQLRDILAELGSRLLGLDFSASS